MVLVQMKFCSLQSNVQVFYLDYHPLVNSPPKLWYEKHLIPFNINDTFNSSPSKFNADYILLNSINDLRKQLILL